MLGRDLRVGQRFCPQIGVTETEDGAEHVAFFDVVGGVAVGVGPLTGELPVRAMSAGAPAKRYGWRRSAGFWAAADLCGELLAELARAGTRHGRDELLVRGRARVRPPASHWELRTRQMGPRRRKLCDAGRGWIWSV